MDTILLALAPFVVSLITNFAKKFQTIQLSDSKKGIIRVLVVVLSFGAALGNSALSGEPIDPLATQTLVNTLFTFLASSGIYFFTKKNN